MDSSFASPYRVAWQPPASVNVSAASRRRVLDALDCDAPFSRRRLQQATGLSPLTLRRACRQLLREGVLTLQYGHDPDTGHLCDLIAPARYPVLPILEITPDRMVWRLCSTCGDSVFATVLERGAFRTAEDDLYLLMSRVTSVLNAGTCGLPAHIPLQPFVLLADATDTAIPKAVVRVLDEPPQRILTPAEAAAREISRLPEAQGASCVLYFAPDTSVTASLLVRSNAQDPDSPLLPTTFATGLEATLRARLQHVPRRSSARMQILSELLQDICHTLTPDCLVIEYDDPPFSEHALPSAALSSLLPPTTVLCPIPVPRQAPSLAHRGALRLSRRALWDSMEGRTL